MKKNNKHRTLFLPFSSIVKKLHSRHMLIIIIPTTYDTIHYVLCMYTFPAPIPNNVGICIMTNIKRIFCCHQNVLSNSSLDIHYIIIQSLEDSPEIDACLSTIRCIVLWILTKKHFDVTWKLDVYLSSNHTWSNDYLAIKLCQ